MCRWRSGWASVSRLLEEGQEFPWEEDSLVRAACEQHRRLRRARLQCSATERGEEAPLRQAGSRFPALHSSSLYFGSVCSQDVHPVPARTPGLMAARSLCACPLASPIIGHRPLCRLPFTKVWVDRRGLTVLLVRSHWVTPRLCSSSRRVEEGTLAALYFLAQHHAVIT